MQSHNLNVPCEKLVINNHIYILHNTLTVTLIHIMILRLSHTEEILTSVQRSQTLVAHIIWISQHVQMPPQ